MTKRDAGVPDGFRAVGAAKGVVVSGRERQDTPRMVIFSSAGSDIINVLSLYQTYSDRREIWVCVVGVKPLYDFLASVGIKPDRLFFIPYPDLDGRTRNPLKVVAARAYVSRQFRRYFGALRGADVYYWTNYFDWITFAFVSRLSQRNNVFSCQLDRSEFLPCKNIDCRSAMLWAVIWFVTGVRVRFASLKRADYLIVAFPKERYAIKDIELKSRFDQIEKFMFRVECDDGGNGILFLDASSPRYGVGAEKKMRHAIEAMLQAGFRVYIKGHPRVGISKCMSDYPLVHVVEHVPAELLKLVGFCGIVGVVSTALASLSESHPEVRAISLLKLFSFTDQRSKQGLREFLESRAGSIVFVEDIPKMVQILRAQRDLFRRNRAK